MCIPRATCYVFRMYYDCMYCVPCIAVYILRIFFWSLFAGFDAHVDDPLAGITLDEEDYHWVTQEICAVAERVRCVLYRMCVGRVVCIVVVVVSCVVGEGDVGWGM